MSEPFEEFVIRDRRDLPQMIDYVGKKVIPGITGALVNWDMSDRKIREDEYILPEEKALKLKQVKDQTEAVVKFGYRQGEKTLERVDAYLDQLEAENNRWFEEKNLAPINDKEWAEANSRANFVREDCQRWATESPSKIVEAYKTAASEGNRIMAYLLKRYGREALAGDQTFYNRLKLENAIRESYGPGFGFEAERINKLRKEVRAAREKLEQYAMIAKEEELRQRFGMH